MSEKGQRGLYIGLHGNLLITCLPCLACWPAVLFLNMTYHLFFLCVCVLVCYVLFLFVLLVLFFFCVCGVCVSGALFGALFLSHVLVSCCGCFVFSTLCIFLGLFVHELFIVSHHFFF